MRNKKFDRTEASTGNNEEPHSVWRAECFIVVVTSGSVLPVYLHARHQQAWNQWRW
jgi:hypothetical protein